MAGAIYLLDRDKRLVELRQTGYLTEDELQDIVASHPRLLSGDDTSEQPRRFVLIRREAGLAGAEDAGARWSMDHLFFDQDGVPTIVEVKRSTDTRIRREVVGQMLDYAANAVVYLPIERIQSWFDERCSREHLDPATVLETAFGRPIDVETYWTVVRTNLQAGRIRLIFLADVIPPELARIVEFLNGQMNPADVLAVEIQQFAAGDVDTRTLVPRTIGRTADAQRTKGSYTPSRQWTHEELYGALAANGGDQVQIAEALERWAKAVGVSVTTGTSSLRFDLLAFKTWFPLFFVRANGRLELTFNTLSKRPVFRESEVRQELVRRLNSISGVTIRPDPNLQPTIPLAVLAHSSPLTAFTSAWEWLVGEVRSAEESQLGS